jgi:outer membrane immunogenic protein
MLGSYPASHFMMAGLISCLLSGISMAEEATYSWTGAYAGANLGVIWTDSQLSANQANLVSTSGSYNENLDATDVNPGFQFGYLHQIDPNWVLGAEADFTYPSANTQYTAIDSDQTYDQFTVKNDLQGSLRLRMGYAIDRFLPYVTTGMSFGSMGLSYNNEQNNAYSVRTTQMGWVLGGGLEYGIFEHLSSRLEYLYTDYGTALNLSLPTIAGISDSQGAIHTNMSTNVLRVALNYRF